MGLQTAPGYIGVSGYQTPVELDRNVMAALAGRRTGAMRYNDFALTPSGGAMQLTIASGSGVLMGGENSNTQGAYFVWSNASEVISMPASAGSARYDTLLLRVIDTQYGTDPTTSKALWEVVSGTPSGTPTPLADSVFDVGGAQHRVGAWWRVADILVPAGVTNLSTATVNNKRKYARIGRETLCLAADLPTDAQRGDKAILVDDNCNLLMYNGSAWQAVDDGGTWTALSPYYAGNVAANSFGYAPAYRLRGNTVEFRGILGRSSGTFTSGTNALAGMPAGIRPAQQCTYECGAAAVAAAGHTVRMDVNPAGSVTPFFTSPGAAYAPNWISLDGIKYDLT